MEEFELIKVLVQGGGAAGATIVALVKNPDILKLLYQDIAQPSVKKVGDALSSVFWLAGTLMLPIKMINEKTQVLFTHHMEKYREKMEKIPNENIVEVPPEIGISVLDKLTYVQDENIAKMYIELLARASDKTDAAKVHPYFITAVNNLTPDEAVFIRNIFIQNIVSNNTKIPYSTIREKNAVKDKGEITIVEYLLNRKYLTNLTFPDNYSLYIDNLIAIGFINKIPDRHFTDANIYSEIKTQNQLLVTTHEQIIKQHGNTLDMENSILEITETGKTFIRLVNK